MKRHLEGSYSLSKPFTFSYTVELIGFVHCLCSLLSFSVCIHYLCSLHSPSNYRNGIYSLYTSIGCIHRIYSLFILIVNVRDMQ